MSNDAQRVSIVTSCSTWDSPFGGRHRRGFSSRPFNADLTLAFSGHRLRWLPKRFGKKSLTSRVKSQSGRPIFLAITPTMPSRKVMTQTTKITPCTTVTQAPRLAR